MIKEGNVLPEVTWDMYTVSGASAEGFLSAQSKRSWKEYKSTEMFQKRCLVIGIPGAWTPTCTEQMQMFDGTFDSVYIRDIEDIYFMGVNDSFCMQSWVWAHYAIKVKWIADGNSEFTEKIGMLVDKSNMGYGQRSWRYAMVVENNTIEKLFVEDGMADNVAFDVDPHGNTSYESVMKYLHNTGRKQDPPDESRWYFKIPFNDIDTSKPEIDNYEDELNRSAKEGHDWYNENEEYQNFNPNTDSIAHKEDEERKKMEKEDKEMEENMLGE